VERRRPGELPHALLGQRRAALVDEGGITKIFEIEVQMLTEDIGAALYRWTHEFPHEIIAGCTSQIFRKLGGRWLVVHENSARVPKD